jgi:hypothetical protein
MAPSFVIITSPFGDWDRGRYVVAALDYAKGVYNEIRSTPSSLRVRSRREANAMVRKLRLASTRLDQVEACIPTSHGQGVSYEHKPGS